MMKFGVSEAAIHGVWVHFFEKLKKSFEKLRCCIQLTKPRIVVWFGFTAMAAMIVEGSMLSQMSALWMIFLGSILCAASANAFNQFIERDLDANMDRTKDRRPLPLGKVTGTEAFVFATTLGCISTGILYFYGNLFAAFFGVATIGFYSLVYTMYLKPRTPYNIVIGGAAGATGPLIGWAAATGEVTLLPMLMFLLVCLWTPPHFWALALVIQKDYAKNKIPMLPVVAGEEVTRKQMFWYCVALIPFSIIPFFVSDLSWIFLVSTLLVGFGFLWKSIVVLRKKTEAAAWSMFKYSLFYLFVFFLAISLDSIFLGNRSHAEELQGKGSAPQVELGKKLFMSKGCFACHSVDGTRKVGPSMKGVFGRKEALTNGQMITVDEDYIRRSMLEPRKEVVQGYPPSMPPFKGVVSDNEMDALISYLKSLK